MAEMKKWSCEAANDWYAKQPWFRGCNYLPADCCNRIAFWQELDFEKHMATAERELALMQSIGYNSIRVVAEYLVYEEEHDSFLERFERFVQLAAVHGISLLVCFGNDCTVPKTAPNPPRLGVQEYDWGYHGGRKFSPHGSYPDAVGYSILDEPTLREKFFRMVEEIVSRYAKDTRICAWDLFNEPGNNNRGEISAPHVQRIFDVARSCSPVQPLTSGVWSDRMNPAEKTALENSDVVSYHDYHNYADSVKLLAELKKYGRPLFCTEWLHRPFHNTVRQMFPLFYLEKVSCWNWGFVAGQSQTYEPWEAMWNNCDPKEVDFTQWQHDLFRPSLRPYDPCEIEIIKRFSEFAVRDFAETAEHNTSQRS